MSVPPILLCLESSPDGECQLYEPLFCYMECPYYGISLLQRPFSEFVSNPPVQDGSPGHRVRPDEVKAILAAHRGLHEEEKRTHFQMQVIADDDEMDAVQSALARESSEYARAKSGNDAPGCLGSREGRICSPGSARRNRACRVNS
jgi:hypothetical protein